MDLRHVIMSPIIMIALLVTSCGGSSDGPPVPEVSIDALAALSVKGLMFTGEMRDIHPEVELHIVNADNNLSILCAGVDTGLESVRMPEQSYDDIEATFLRTNGMESRKSVARVYIVALERDSSQCPGRPVWESDTVLARSEVMNADQLIAGKFSLNQYNSGNVSFGVIAVPQISAVAGDLLNLHLANLDLGDIYPDEGSEPELELHFVDIATNRSVACMTGGGGGIPGDAQSYTSYPNLYARPILANGIDATTPISRIRVLLVDRDNGNCPATFEYWNDNVIAGTKLLSVSDLLAGSPISMVENETKITFVDDRDVETGDADKIAALSIDEIMFVGSDFGELSTPDVEVHLVDADSGAIIACAANGDGLAGVVNSDELYSALDVPLIKVWSSLASPSGYVRIKIVDRDVGACPDPATEATVDFIAEVVVSAKSISAAPILFNNGSMILFK